MNPKYLLVLVLALFSKTLTGQTFTMNERCLDAYQCFMAMKVTKGKSILLQELKSNPRNRLPIVLANYEEFISLVFNENPEEYQKRKPLKEKRLSLLENADKNSPYYLFSKALIYFQWSMIQIKYTEYWDAAWDFRKSFLLFKENKKKFPDFPFNDIFIGSQETVISTIPKGYKWISTILGLKGDMRLGLSLLKSSINTKDRPFKEEAFLYMIYLKNYIENDAEGANQLIKNYHLDLRDNQLFCFMAANLALNNKKASVTESILSNRNMSHEFIPFPLLEYEMGDAKLRRLSPDAAQHFLKFMNTSKSNFYIKDACLNVAYCYYLEGNMELADQYKEKIKQVGKAESDADKLAQKFAESGSFPDRELLKARLLNDGGYNEKSLGILQGLHLNSFKKGSEQLEYIYRFGRVYDDLKQDDKALEYYKQTIKMGLSSTEYFASRAALQAGYICEERGQKKEALDYYNLALDMDDHEYKNSIDQRAKSGINRINRR